MSVRERRSLWGSISTSRKVNRLSLKAALRYTWAIPHVDDEGVQEGDPQTLKARVVPLRDEIPVSEIAQLTKEIIDQGLWLLYTIKPEERCEEIYIQDPVFDKRQTFKDIYREPSQIRQLLGFDRTGMGPPITDKSRKDIYERDNYRCVYCGSDLRNDHHKICLDHVIPLSRRGSSTLKNLVTSCKKCNALKSDRTPDEAGLKWPDGFGEKEELIPVNGGSDRGLTEGKPNDGRSGDQVKLSEEKGSEVKRSEEKGSEGGPRPSPRDWPKQLAEIFNSTIQYLPKVTDLSEGRLEKLRTRKKQKPDLDWWKVVFEKADLILIPGKDGKKDWYPSFDWLIKNDTNAVKVFEGNYDDAKRPPPKFSPQPGMDAWLKRKLEEEGE